MTIGIFYYYFSVTIGISRCWAFEWQYWRKNVNCHISSTQTYMKISLLVSISFTIDLYLMTNVTWYPKNKQPLNWVIFSIPFHIFISCLWDGSTNYFSGKIQNTFKSPSPCYHQSESLKGRGREAIAMKQTILPKIFKVNLCPTQSIRHWQVR